MDPQPTTRERLIGAAASLFAERGFRGADVRSICNIARVNPGAVSYHFQRGDADTNASSGGAVDYPDIDDSFHTVTTSLTYHMLENGEDNDVVDNMFNVHVFPTSYVVGKEGRVMYCHIGFEEGDEDGIEQEILDLFAETEQASR